MRELRWKLRNAKFGVLIRILRLQPADPKSVLAPFFKRIEDAVDDMLAQDAHENHAEIIGVIGWEYDEYLRMRSEDVTARAEMATMADASFQEWLDTNFPDLPRELRQKTLDLYRAGAL